MLDDVTADRPSASHRKPVQLSELEWCRGVDHLRIAFSPVDAGDIDVELDLVAVWISDVTAVSHRVIRGRGDFDTGVTQGIGCSSQVFVVVADSESDVEQAHPWPCG